jgi:hypothetical protein
VKLQLATSEDIVVAEHAVSELHTAIQLAIRYDKVTFSAAVTCRILGFGSAPVLIQPADDEVVLNTDSGCRCSTPQLGYD